MIKIVFRFLSLCAVAALCAGAWAQYVLSRKSLANSASFTVQQIILPQGGSKIITTYKVEVSGTQARLDYEDSAIGAVRYVTNEKGVYFYTPANQSAVRQQMKGGIEAALQVAFSQVSEQMRGAKKIRSETVSGQPTDVFKDGKTGTLIYIGKNPGFRLPVKTVLTNVGGTRTLLVTNIKLNPKLGKERFALPPGTKVIEGDAVGNSPAGGF